MYETMKKIDIIHSLAIQTYIALHYIVKLIYYFLRIIFIRVDVILASYQNCRREVQTTTLWAITYKY